MWKEYSLSRTEKKFPSSSYRGSLMQSWQSLLITRSLYWAVSNKMLETLAEEVVLNRGGGTCIKDASRARKHA